MVTEQTFDYLSLVAKIEKHKVFISYHHKNDQKYKEHLVLLNETFHIFTDKSVDIGDIDSDKLNDEGIARKIRTDFLTDSSVTILLVGEDTRNRKHVDWEIYSSMYDGSINSKSGILVIYLPTIPNHEMKYIAHGEFEKKIVYPDNLHWVPIGNRSEIEINHPYLPDRIIDNLERTDSYISVVPWSRIQYDPVKLKFLIDQTFKSRENCKYNLSRPMRKRNS